MAKDEPTSKKERDLELPEEVAEDVKGGQTAMKLPSYMKVPYKDTPGQK